MKLRAEFAKSSRARCRACGKMIQGGTIRWAKENEDDDIRPQYTHLSCLNLARGTREKLTEKDIIYDADFTKKQRDAIVEAFHLTAEEKPEQRRMEAIKRHEVAPEKKKDKPDHMEDEGEDEGESEEKKEDDEDEEDEEYVDEEGNDDEKEERDEDEYMEDEEVEADLDEVNEEASDFQKPKKRRRKNEESEEMSSSEEKQSAKSQSRGRRGSSQRAKEVKGPEKETKQPDKGRRKGGDEAKKDNIQKKYENMGSDELQGYLRANKQIMSGPLEDLRKRCIDCELYGALPTCPQCQKGRLMKNERTGKVECHGYYDEDAGMPARCGFNEDEKKIQRRPWREPSEAPPVLFNVHIKGEEGPASLTAEVKKKLESIVGSKRLSKRDTAKELMKYGRESELELPKDDNEAMDAIEEHLDEHTEDSNIDYEAAFAEIAREYSKDPEIREMGKAKSKIEKNEKIADALNELATLYGKLGGQDRFRARAEKKAAGAVRSLDFEVKSGKELSTGDTKVEGIGHDTGEMIDEFLQTGKIEKLEDARRRVKEQQSE